MLSLILTLIVNMAIIIYVALHSTLPIWCALAAMVLVLILVVVLGLILKPLDHIFFARE